mgnify:CR=1 FL=1
MSELLVIDTERGIYPRQEANTNIQQTTCESSIQTESSDTIIINTDVVKPKPPACFDIFGEQADILKKPVPYVELKLPSKEVHDIVYRMFQTAERINALGLSANQCGVMARILILNFATYKEVFLDPRIVFSSDNETSCYEYNSSYPALKLKISRPEWIEVQYKNMRGDLMNARLEDAHARYFLHHLELLDGIPFTNKVGKTALNIARQRQKKQLKGLDATRMLNSLNESNKNV